ncbi:hypothetical protein BH24ACT3_BH24ACT3_08980 [soil metagenome]
MILAALEVYHSRPIAPTRRVALGRQDLPVDPVPGFGGILLGGMVAAYIDEIEADLHVDLHRLTLQLEHGQRIPQPRLRHRFQVDRVGLARRRHRLLGDGERLDFDLDDDHGAPMQQILAAVYAAGGLAPGCRGPVLEVLRRAMRWRGPIGPALVEHLSGVSGARAWSAMAFDDPVAWALDVLGLALNGDTDGPGRRQVQRRFRDLLREAHPDHGAAPEGAAQRITDLTEARRILLTP